MTTPQIAYYNSLYNQHQQQGSQYIQSSYINSLSSKYESIYEEKPRPTTKLGYGCLTGINYRSWLIQYLNNLIFQNNGMMIGSNVFNIVNKPEKAKLENRIEIVCHISNFINIASAITQYIQSVFKITTKGPVYLDSIYPDIDLLNDSNISKEYQIVEITFARDDLVQPIVLWALIIINKNPDGSLKPFDIPYGIFKWEHEYLMYDGKNYKNYYIAQSLIDRFVMSRAQSPTSGQWKYPPGLDISSTPEYNELTLNYLTQIINNTSSNMAVLLPFAMNSNPVDKPDNTIWENIINHSATIPPEWKIDLRFTGKDSSRYWITPRGACSEDILGCRCWSCGVSFHDSEYYILLKKEKLKLHRDCLVQYLVNQDSSDHEKIKSIDYKDLI